MGRTIENELSQRVCSDCGSRFTIIHGTILNDGRDVALYSIGLHGHEGDVPAAKMNLIVVRQRGKDVAATMSVFFTATGIGFRFEDWDATGEDERVAPLQTADEARKSRHREALLQLAAEAVQSVPEALDYLGGSLPPKPRRKKAAKRSPPRRKR